MKSTAPVIYSPPPDAFAGTDIVRRFLAWAQCADAEDRAEAASALARAYLYSGLTPSARAEAAVAMTALLDDPSAFVRRALAEALAGARDAPRHLIVALAADQSDVAAAVLARSPVLTDAEIVDCAAIGDVVAQCAIARRPNLGPGAAAALIEVGERDAALTLIGNPDVDLPPSALSRVFERFGDDAEAREALLGRPFLPASLKADIAAATARALSAAAARWLSRERAERITREAREQAIATIAACCGREERAELVRNLRKSGALTPALLLRSLLGGERDLFAAALVELTGMPLRRVAAFIRDSRGEGFAALARKAGLATHHLPVFRAALAAINGRTGASGEGLKVELIEMVIAACEKRGGPALAKTLSLLWRFAAEAGREHARIFARGAISGASARRLPQSNDLSPAANDEGGAAPGIVIDLLGLTVDSPDQVAALNEAGEDAAARIELSIEVIAGLDAGDNEDVEPPFLTVVAQRLDASIEAPGRPVAIDPFEIKSPDWVARLNEAWEDVTRRMELSIDFAALEETGTARRLPQSLDFSPSANDIPEERLSSFAFDPPGAIERTPDSGDAIGRRIDADRGEAALSSSRTGLAGAGAEGPDPSPVLATPDEAAAPPIEPPIETVDTVGAGGDEEKRAPLMNVEPQHAQASFEAPELGVGQDEPDAAAAPRLPPSLDFSPAANDEIGGAPTNDPISPTVEAPDSIACVVLDEDVAARADLPIGRVDELNRAA